jgi:hypothetical protein
MTNISARPNRLAQPALVALVMLIPFAAGVGVVFAINWAIPSAASVSVEGGTVIKVCRDGTLVLQVHDGYAIVRPDKQTGWPAASADVCER